MCVEAYNQNFGFTDQIDQTFEIHFGPIILINL